MTSDHRKNYKYDLSVCDDLRVGHSVILGHFFELGSHKLNECLIPTESVWANLLDTNSSSHSHDQRLHSSPFYLERLTGLNEIAPVVTKIYANTTAKS